METGTHTHQAGNSPLLLFRVSMEKTESQACWFLNSNLSSVCCIQGNKKQLMQMRPLLKTPNGTCIGVPLVSPKDTQSHAPSDVRAKFYLDRAVEVTLKGRWTVCIIVPTVSRACQSPYWG